jgi:hypothetical protein
MYAIAKYVQEYPSLELKTEPSFCPVSYKLVHDQTSSEFLFQESAEYMACPYHAVPSNTVQYRVEDSNQTTSRFFS